MPACDSNANGCPRLRAVAGNAVDFFLGDRSLVDDADHAVVVARQSVKARLGLNDHRPGPFELRIVHGRVDLEEQRVFLDVAAILEVHGLQVAGHLRPQVDGLLGLDVTGEVLVGGHVLGRGPGDDDLRVLGLGQGRRGLLATAERDDADQAGEQETGRGGT